MHLTGVAKKNKIHAQIQVMHVLHERPGRRPTRRLTQKDCNVIVTINSMKPFKPAELARQ